MAPPILSLALPSETGRVLSIQSHTVQVLLVFFFFIFSFVFDIYRSAAVCRERERKSFIFFFPDKTELLH